MRALDPSMPHENPGSAAESTRYTGWLVLRRLPAEPLDFVVVTNSDGKAIAHRPLPYGAVGSRGWDITLKQLGFERVGVWQAVTGGFKCRLEQA